MTVLLVVVSGVVLAIVSLNAWATHAVLADTLATPSQRLAQLAFVWLIPLLGALLTLRLKRGDPEKPLGRFRNEPEPPDDFGDPLRRHRNTGCDRDTNPDAGDGMPDDSP